MKIYDNGHAHYFGCCDFREFSGMNMMVVLVVSTQIYFYNNERFQMQWAQTASVCAAKSCALSGQKQPIHCQYFILASAFLIMKTLAWSFHKVNKLDSARLQVPRDTGMVTANFWYIGQF